MQAVAMAHSVAWDADRIQQHAEIPAAPGLIALSVDRGAELARLSGFRTAFYRCLRARADELFELTDAVLCTDGPVKTLVGLSLAPEHRRGHGALYDAVSHGRVEIAALSVALTAITLPRLAGRITLAIDVTPWLRPDAATSPGRLFCHVHGRRKDEHLMIPGWPYSMVAALEEGRTSWTRLIDARRLRPDDDEAAVTAAQVRDVVMRIIASGQHKPGDPDILLVFDAGYDLARLSFLLGDLPVQVLGRLRGDRVMGRTPPPRPPGTTGRPARPVLAGVPPPLRHRAHLPVPQADTRLDRPAHPRPGRRRHLDLADPRRLHPAVARTAPHRRSAPPLGKTRTARQTHPRPRPPRVS